MAYLALAAAAAVFVACFKLFGVVPTVRRAIAGSRQAHAVISSKELTDDQKEVRVQRAAIEMAGSVVAIFARGGACVALAVAPVGIGIQAGLLTAAETATAATDWVFIAISSVVMIAAMAVLK